MKKLILSLAIITAASFSAFAAGQTDQNAKCAKTECAKSGKCEKKESKCDADKKCDSDKKKCCKKGAPGKQKGHKKGHGMKDGRGGVQMRAFEGIELTAEQKQKLSDLRPQRMERPQNDKAKGKTELTQEQRAAKRAEMQSKREEAMKKYNEEVKNILTPEQYAKFLENQKNMKPSKSRK